MLLTRILEWLHNFLTTKTPQQAKDAKSCRISASTDKNSWSTLVAGQIDEVIAKLESGSIDLPPGNEIHIRLLWYEGEAAKGKTLKQLGESFSTRLEPDGRSSAGSADEIVRGMAGDRHNVTIQALEQTLRASKTLADYGERSLDRADKLWTRVDELEKRLSERASSAVLDEAKADALRIGVARFGEVSSAARAWFVLRNLPGDFQEMLKTLLRRPDRAEGLGAVLDAIGVDRKDRMTLIKELMDYDDKQEAQEEAVKAALRAAEKGTDPPGDS